MRCVRGKRWGEEVDVLVIGNDEGPWRRTRAPWAVRHIPQVKCNSHGRP
jgi:hypothetical protein